MKRQLGRLSKKQRAILIIAAGLILVAGVVVYYYMQTNQKGDTSNQQSASDSQAKIEASLSLSREVAEIAQSQGGDAAQERLDEEISQASTKQEKAEIYNLKISILYSSNDPNVAARALEYAYKIEEIDPTHGSALTIAEMERDANNKAVALKYYELYMERSTNSDGSSLDPSSKSFYEQRIQELKSQL